MAKINKPDWFTIKEPTEAAVAVFDEVSRIRNEQKERTVRNIRCMKLYGSSDFGALFPAMGTPLAATLPANRVRYNIIASCVDTVSSKIAKLKTKVTFLTSGGAWEAQSKAKMLNKFIQGMFQANKIWDLHKKAFKDSLIFDIGALHHFRADNKIMTERVLPTELHFDLVDSIYGDPKLLYKVKVVDKSTLRSMYPTKKVTIAEAKTAEDPYNPGMRVSEGQATVIESWKLPSAVGADDGIHMISCSSGELFREPWKYSTFPFTFHRWAEMPVGAYGQALADRLTGNQIEINKMLQVIQKSFHLGSVFKVFLEQGSKVVKEQMNNEIGGFVYYAGTMPQVVVPRVVSQEMFQYLNWLIEKAYEESGVSQLSASAKRPSGIDAKVALRELQDIESERFILASQSYEDSFLTTAQWYVDLAKEIDADGEEISVLAESKKFVEKISWKDIDITGNEIVIQKFPTSMLPATPAGKLQYVQELMDAGLVDPVMGKRLLDFPDTDAFISLDVAALDTIMDSIDQMISKGKFVAPEPYMDLTNGLKWVQAAYNRGLVDEVPENRLQLLRDWMTNAEAMLTTQAQAAQAAAQPPAQEMPAEAADIVPPAETPQ